MFICNMLLHYRNAMFKVVNYKSFSGFGWTLRTCKTFKRMTHHTPHELHPLMLTFVVFSFNTKKVHDFAMRWNGTQKLALMMSYINHCFQIVSFSVCHFSSTIASTSYNTSSNKIKLSSSSTTKWLDLVVWKFISIKAHELILIHKKWSEVIDNCKTRRQKGFETLNNHKIRRQRGFEAPNNHKTRRWIRNSCICKTKRRRKSKGFEITSFAKQKGENDLKH
jgi:hypothetical protein